MRLHHVGLSVGDLDAATAWYERALGYVVDFRAQTPTMSVAMGHLPDGTGFELLDRTGSVAGAQRLQPDEALLTRGFGHIALQVDDLDETYARLLDAGAEQVWPPRQSPEPGVSMSFVHDPEGNLIELIARDGGR
jgi:catechol 2,3-dioxygenase-like lactoylglutathione lyase family enzyme